uniref:Uncharacterized protein n=1 Tax=Opuntia streptacantha TaxID=393608 RepID=A0A7C9D8G1_OPUST
MPGFCFFGLPQRFGTLPSVCFLFFLSTSLPLASLRLRQVAILWPSCLHVLHLQVGAEDVGFSSESKRSSAILLRTASLQELYFAGTCGGSLSKSKDRRRIATAHSESSKPASR